MLYKIELEPRKIVDPLFGIFSREEDLILVNHLIPAAMLYIYRCKLNGSHPVLRVLNASIKVVYDIEKVICVYIYMYIYICMYVCMYVCINFVNNKMLEHDWFFTACTCLNWLFQVQTVRLQTFVIGEA